MENKIQLQLCEIQCSQFLCAQQDSTHKVTSNVLSAPPTLKEKTFYSSEACWEARYAKLAHCNVASNARPEIEDPPITNRSGIWSHFGFPVNYEGHGERVVDKKSTVCLICCTRVSQSYFKHVSVNDLRRHHPVCQ